MPNETGDAEPAEDLVKHHLTFIEDHLATYLRTGGAEGHIVDMSHTGVPRPLPTLLLKTIGRRSGREHIAPLIYGYYGGEWVVVASKGGAPDHPAWFLNLEAREQVEFQIATQAFSGRWRLVNETERDEVWRYMVDLFPPYADYQRNAGERNIPLVMLTPKTEAPVFAKS